MSRRRLLVGIVAVSLLLVGIAYVGAGVLDPAQDSPTAGEPPSEQRMIEPVDNGSELWPYTSRAETTSQRTLAVNVIIHGDPDKIRTTLVERTDLDFQEMDEDEQDAESHAYEIELSDTEFDWGDAHGSTRYSYIEGPDGGQWMEESYQLHAGEYLGQRYHIRAYEDPAGEYTAIQIHREYFELFMLRHSVDDIDESAVLLEDEFIGEPFVAEVNREYKGMRGGWSDGWVTSIHLGTLFPLNGLLAVLVLGSVASSSSREAVRSLLQNLVDWTEANWTGFLLVAVLVALVAGTRTVGIGLERQFPAVSTQLFAALVYPMLALGPPIAVAVLARRLEPVPAFGFAVVGLGTGFMLDTLWLELGVVPVEIIMHRVGLLLALGVLAIGVAREVSDDADTIAYERAIIVVVGLLAWITGLVMPLLGMV